MAIILDVYSVGSPNLSASSLPSDPDDCAVLIETYIGIKEQGGGERFTFIAITRKFLAHDSGTRWGRGYLLLDTFTWETVEAALENLIAHINKPIWSEVVQELNKEMNWEFENYQPNS